MFTCESNLPGLPSRLSGVLEAILESISLWLLPAQAHTKLHNLGNSRGYLESRQKEQEGGKVNMPHYTFSAATLVIGKGTITGLRVSA